jgi:hypothetical protein
MSEPEETSTMPTEVVQFARKDTEIVHIEDDKEGEKKKIPRRKQREGKWHPDQKCGSISPRT